MLEATIDVLRAISFQFATFGANSIDDEPPKPTGGETMTSRRTSGISRREFLRFASVSTAGSLLAACAPQRAVTPDAAAKQLQDGLAKWYAPQQK